LTGSRVGSTTTVANLEFPVLATSGPVIHVYRSAEELTNWDARTLVSEFARHLSLIDSTLSGYRVLGIRKVGIVQPFWGWRLLEPRRIRVELKLGPPEQLKLDDVKQRLFQAFDHAPDFWESGGDLEDQKDEIRSMRNFEEMVRHFLPKRK
jgi:hypothetical protein